MRNDVTATSSGAEYAHTPFVRFVVELLYNKATTNRKPFYKFVTSSQDLLWTVQCYRQPITAQLGYNRLRH